MLLNNPIIHKCSLTVIVFDNFFIKKYLNIKNYDLHYVMGKD